MNHPSSRYCGRFRVDGDELRRIGGDLRNVSRRIAFTSIPHSTVQSHACHAALDYASEETVRRDRRDLIGAVHLLIGLAREPSDVAGVLLRQYGVTHDRLRKWVDRGCPPERISRDDGMPRRQWLDHGPGSDAIANCRTNGYAFEQLENVVANLRERC